ncbi:hypothetical protein INT45_002965 [Circinella minor]|uniref:TPR-like protein n=1 Tax=Circinella minor TaxID=1195481 RepID=A0A8H7S882_9FUNG|nr:hypothetical protein INT45_002965 [Circinella minor]
MENKATQSAIDLDIARCRGEWSSIPQLAQRYKKYHPDETVLDIAACIEAEFIEQTQTQKQRSTGEEHINDTPDSIYISPSLNSNQTQSFIQRLIDITHGKKDNLELPDDRQGQFAKIILARIYFESGDYDKALESLQNLALRIEDATSGYGLVLLIQARAIKGICYEKQDNISMAIDAFSTAWDVVEQHLKEKSETLWYWIEECLYHGILLQLRTRSSPLRLMQAYLKLAKTYWSNSWRTYKQWVIFNIYVRYISKFDSPYENDNSLSGNELEDVIPVMDILRKLFRSLVLVSTNNELNQRTLELANLTSNVHDRVGWGDVRHLRRVLQFLYQAKEYTFNNANITRHLLLTLLRLGEFNEAKYTFASYMDLVGASDIDNIDEPKHYDVIEISRRMGLANETKEGFLSVCFAGTELYGHIYGDGKMATMIMHVALNVVEEELQNYGEQDNGLDTGLVARVYRVHGAACGVYARQCDDPETRSEYHSKSIESLTKAIRLDEEHPSWHTHYEYAVELASTRSLYDAATAISKSIQLNPNHLPSWHLLALLHSCQENNEPQALQTLEAGLNHSALSSDYNQMVAGSAPVLSWNKNEKSVSQYMTLAESHLAMTMTQVQLLEKLEGPDAILDLYTDLFSIYAKLATHLNDGAIPNESVIEDGLQHLEDTMSMNGRQNSMNGGNGMGSRRSSRSLSLSKMDPRRRSNSVSNNSSRPTEFGNNTETPPVSSSGTGLKPPRRMKSSSSDETRSDRKGSFSGRTRSSSINREGMSIRKKSMQLIDMGFARRMGSTTQHSSKNQSSGSALYDEKQQQNTPNSEASSATLMSLLTPSFSAASMGTPERRPSNTSPTISALLNKPTQFYTRYQRDRWYHLLVKLWLMSTTTFIRAGRLEEATKAIVEAEQQLLAGQMNDASVWYQLGMVCIQKSKKLSSSQGDKEKLHDTGLDALKKALAIDPDHIEALVAMARCFIDLEEWELAEGLLDRATRGYGWDHAEAWYYLGVCYRHDHNLEQAKNCFQYAVELNETTPLQSFSQLPRFVQ